LSAFRNTDCDFVKFCRTAAHDQRPPVLVTLQEQGETSVKPRWKSAARLAFAAALVAPLASRAGDGPYLGIEGGMNLQSRQDVLQSGINTGNLSFQNGFVAGLAGGYAFVNGFRPELELDFRRNDLEQFITSGTALSAGGFETATSVLGNLWYDYKAPSGFFHVVHPYLGVGLGAARLAARHVRIGSTALGNDYDWTFAYQGGAGFAVDVTPRLSVSYDWRYLQTNRGSFDVGLGAPLDARYRSNSAMLSLRYSFGAPPALPQPVAETPPAPTPQPPVAPPPPKPVCHPPAGFKVDENCKIIEQKVILRSINFQLNSDRLTVPSQQTLDEVAQALIAQPELEVEIDGYTDSTGSAAYNLRLSQRRAEAVKNYLVAKGVKAQALTAKGYGASRPIASNKTAEGRAQNRRVEFVVLHTPAHVKVVEQDATAASKAAAQETARPPGKRKR
jgi:OOP family OmpA-OmpF porin